MDLCARSSANAFNPLNASIPLTLVGESVRSKSFLKLRFKENAFSNFSKLVPPSLPSSSIVPKLSKSKIARKNVLKQKNRDYKRLHKLYYLEIVEINCDFGTCYVQISIRYKALLKTSKETFCSANSAFGIVLLQISATTICKLHLVNVPINCRDQLNLR